MGALRDGLRLPARKRAAAGPPGRGSGRAASPPRSLLGGVVSRSEELLRAFAAEMR